MKDWLLHGGIHEDEQIASDLAGPGITSTGATCWHWHRKPTCKSAATRAPTTGIHWR
jgi:hypothetical protein